MWVARIRMWHAGSASIELTRKYDVRLTAYYLNAFQEKGSTFINRLIVVRGPESAKFVRDFVESEKPRVKLLEIEDNHIFYTIKSTEQYHSVMLGNLVFFVKPIQVEGGFELWTVGSHDKAQIVELVKRINNTKLASAEMMSLRQEKHLLPSGLSLSLSEKQLNALELAFKEGYYSYPRKVTLGELAQKAHLSKTALRASLRRAEAVIIKNILE